MRGRCPSRVCAPCLCPCLGTPSGTAAPYQTPYPSYGTLTDALSDRWQVEQPTNRHKGSKGCSISNKYCCIAFQFKVKFSIVCILLYCIVTCYVDVALLVGGNINLVHVEASEEVAVVVRQHTDLVCLSANKRDYFFKITKLLKIQKITWLWHRFDKKNKKMIPNDGQTTYECCFKYDQLTDLRMGSILSKSQSRMILFSWDFLISLKSGL